MEKSSTPPKYEQRVKELQHSLVPDTVHIFKYSDSWVYDAKIVYGLSLPAQNASEDSDQAGAGPQVVACTKGGQVIAWNLRLDGSNEHVPQGDDLPASVRDPARVREQAPATCRVLYDSNKHRTAQHEHQSLQFYRLQHDSVSGNLYCSSSFGSVLCVPRDAEPFMMPVHEETVNGICLNEQARHILYTASLDESIGIFDLNKQVVKRNLPIGFTIGQVVHNGDFNLLAASGVGQSILLFDERTSRLVRKLETKVETTIVKLKFLDTAPFGRVLASGDHARRMMLWDIVRGEWRLQDQTANEAIFGIAHSARLNTVFYSSWDAKVRALDLVSQQVVQEYKEHQFMAIACEYDEASGWLVSTARDARVVARHLHG